MIITCPACATAHDFPAGTPLADGAVLRCDDCGHTWLESQAREIQRPQDVCGDIHLAHTARSLQAEAEKLAEEALRKEKARRARQARRRAEMRRWGALAAAISAIALGLWSFPAEVVRAAPGAARIYALLGVKVHPRGFDIANVSTSQFLTTSGQVVLAVSGTIRNVSRLARKAPGLAFTLVDDKGRKLHEWSLPAVSARALAAGKTARFITRIASPPKGARRIEVRFLRKS